MTEPKKHGRERFTLWLTPGAVQQVHVFGQATGIPTLTEAVEAMIAIAAPLSSPDRIARALKAQEATGYRR